MDGQGCLQLYLSNMMMNPSFPLVINTTIKVLAFVATNGAGTTTCRNLYLIMYIGGFCNVKIK